MSPVIGLETEMVIGLKTEMQFLLEEWKSLRDEQKMYVEQYSPRFTIFSVFVLSAFGFAFQKPQYEFVYMIIPLFIFLLIYVTIGQAHVIAALGGRIRRIENQLRELNGDKSLLEWESCYAPRLVFAPVLNLKWIKDGETHTRRSINPIFLSAIFVSLATTPLIVYSTWRAFVHLPVPWDWVYVAFVAVCSVAALIQGFSFFFAGVAFGTLVLD